MYNGTPFWSTFWYNIGIKHVVLSCIKSARSQESCLNTRPLGQEVKHFLGDLASVNAMKIIYDFYYCIFLLDSNQNYTENAAVTFKYHFLHWISLKPNGAGCKLLNVILPSQHHSCVECFREKKKRISKMISLGKKAFCITSCKQLRAHSSIVNLNPMFKQHVNLINWKWIVTDLTMALNSYVHTNVGIYARMSVLFPCLIMP